MDKPLYNSIVIKTYLEYLKSNYPDINLTELLNYAGMTEYELEDRGHWLTQTQINRFHEYMGRATSNPDLSRQAGRFIASRTSSAYRVLQQTMSGFLSPAVAYWAVEKVGTNFSRHQTIKGRSLSKNKFELLVTAKPGVKEEPFQCDNRIGMYEAIAEMFTGKYATIDHPECQHHGAPCCRYIVSWESPKSLLWTKIGSYTLAASVLASFPLLFFLPLEHWLIATLSSLLLSTGILFFGSILHNRETAANLIQQGRTSEEVLAQINLRYNESLLMREIGEAASTILNPRELLIFITDALNQRLMYERSMVMLTNPERTKLIYGAGHGSTPHEEALLNNLRFSLTPPESKGYFYQAYVSQKPVIVDSAALAESNLSETSYHLIKELGVTSFICVPIVYKGTTEGVLGIDLSRSSRKPSQSDVSLLVGIAQQIAVSLSNALAHNNAREHEERFRNLSESATDIIYQLDPEGKIKYVNPAWEELLGNRPTDVNGKYLGDFMKQEDRLAFALILQNIFKDKCRVRDKNFTMFNARGLPRNIALSGAPDVDAEGHVIGMVGMITDISKMRSMETQLLQAFKMQTIGTLTGDILHDFNKISQAIMGYHQMTISDRFGNDVDAPCFNSIGDIITRSREIIRQLLLLNRKVDTLSRTINLNDEVKTTCKLLSKSLTKMIDIKMDLSPDLLPIIADSTQIGQIILNLVINARDAIGDGGVIIIKTGNLSLHEESVMHGRQIPAGAYVQMCLSDTGCGMGADLIKRIFEPFFTTKEPGKGTGLGLAIVYGIVKNHDGYIFCESETDKGTTFYIIIPASPSGSTADTDQHSINDNKDR